MSKLTRLGSWSGGVLVLAGTVLSTVALTSASATPALLLHPNHVLSGKPGGPGGHGGGGGGGSSYGWASSNWSGYIVTPTGTHFTSVTGQWTVPTVTGSRRSGLNASALWAGIDGNSSANPALIQTGTEQDYELGATLYRAWWTTSELNYQEQIISSGCSGAGSCGSVQPGDHMSADIVETATANVWSITLTDATASWTFSTTVDHQATGESAEWIVEAPSSISGVLPLANYGTVAFDAGTVDGSAPGLVAADGGDMIQNGRVVSSPSGPDTEPASAPSDGFASSYGSSPPAAPSS